METIWKVFSCFVVLLFLELCNGLPLDLDHSYGDENSLFFTGLLSIVLAVCAIVCLAGCLCCKPRNGFKEFRDSPVVVSMASNLDDGHLNPILNGGEFTIFTPLTSIPSQHNIFSAREEIISRVNDDYIFGDINVSSWYNINETDFPRAKLKYIRELGKGWFGRVVEGTALGLHSEDTTWSPVVVRILEATASNRERVLFLHDAAIYRCPSHPNVLQILGRCLENVPLLLLQEYCSQGDLKAYLRQQQICKEIFLTGKLPLLWCQQIASALHHLHKHNIIHPDLATRNCRLSDDLMLKVGDYGCGASDYPEDYYNGSENVPVRWCAPECVVCTSTTIQRKKVTRVSNIWTLGICFWEICECGIQPYSNLTDDEVISQVFGPKHYRLQKPAVNTEHIDYIYRLMQLCWLDEESRPTSSQIVFMLQNLNDKINKREDFDSRWDQLKPNAIVRSVEMFEQENDFTNITVLNMNLEPGNKLSASMHNLAGSLENLIEPSKNLNSNLGGDDISFINGLSAAIHDLDDAIALENVSSDAGPRLNKLHFALETARTSSGSETEDENWKRKIESGAYTEKVRQKSRSVADLMVLTHIDCSESDSETPLPSLGYKSGRFQLDNVNLSFGSEGNLLNVHSTFAEELKKLQEERRDSLLFVPDKTQSQNLACSSLFDSPPKKLIEDLNSSSDIKPQNQVFNVYNVITISPKYSPIHSTHLNCIINYNEHLLPDVVLNAIPSKIPKLSQIIENNLELMDYITEKYDVNDLYKVKKFNYQSKAKKGLKPKYNKENTHSSDCEIYDSILKCNTFSNNRPECINQNSIEARNNCILATNNKSVDNEDSFNNTNILDAKISNVSNYGLKLKIHETGRQVENLNINKNYIDEREPILKTNIEIDQSEKSKVYMHTEKETNEIVLVDYVNIENICYDNMQEIKGDEIDHPEIQNNQSSKVSLTYLPNSDCCEVLDDALNSEEKVTILSKAIDLTDNILESVTIKSPRKCISIVMDEITHEQNAEVCESIEDIDEDDKLKYNLDISDYSALIAGYELENVNNVEETNDINFVDFRSNPLDFSQRNVNIKSDDMTKTKSDNIVNISKIFDTLVEENPNHKHYQSIENQLTVNSEYQNQNICQANNIITDQPESIGNLESKLEKVSSPNLDNLECLKHNNLVFHCGDNIHGNETKVTNNVNFEYVSPQEENLILSASVPNSKHITKKLIVKTQNFLNNEILNYEGIPSLKVDFDVSEAQEEMAPNSLTHSIFTSIPYVKQHLSSVIIGASDDFSINYYNGLKTTTEDQSSIFIKKGSDMKYSLETWDNFLGKSFDEQHDRLITEPQSLLFVDGLTAESKTIRKDVKNCETEVADIEDVKLVMEDKKENYSIGNVINEEYSTLNGTVTLEEDNEKDGELILNNTFTKDVDLNDIKFEMEEGTFGDSDNRVSWESETSGGWFLHPQTKNECLSGEIDILNEESYVGFSMDDEVMAAIRNELLTKLPQAQRANSDLLFDDEVGEYETSDRNEVFIKYNLYNTPLSPIPEESYSELLHSDQSTPHCTINTNLEDSDSDWSIPEMGKNSLIDDDTQSPRILESPHKGPQCRHTPSQESCCSNDTLFNLEELQYTEKANECVDNSTKTSFSEQNKFHKCNITHESSSENDNDIVPKEPILYLESKVLTPLDSSINEYDSIPSCTDNTTIQIIQELKHEIMNELATSKEYSDEIAMKTNVLKDTHVPSQESSSSSEAYLTVSNSPCFAMQNVAPLNSPEDRPWRYVEASLTECLENEQNDKYSEFLEKQLCEEVEDKMNFKNSIVSTENIYDCVVATEGIPFKNYEICDKNCDYVNELVLNDAVHNYVNEIDKVGYLDGMINLEEKDDEDNAVYESVYSEPVYDEVQDRMAEFCNPLGDIRFSGPGDSQMMSTSFSDSADLGDDQDWDSGSDTRSSSSGEFIWKEGEHEASVKALHASPQDNEMQKCEDIKSEEYSSSGSEEDGDGLEFVPSAWNKYAMPMKSALRSPEKSLEKEKKGVSFKKQKYHCVYEYPKEPDSPLVQNYDVWASSKYKEDWNINTDLFMSGTSTDTEKIIDTTIPSHSLYETSKVPDFIGSSLLEDDFYITSSAKPFDVLSGNCQFFPGKQLCDWEELIKNNDNITPDSGVEDITPSLSDSDYVRPCRKILPLKTLAQLILNKSSGRNEIGGLRHTRNSLKLDLPPSPTGFTQCFAVEPIDPIITRHIPTFTTFGKSRFVVQHVDTPTDEDSTKNVSFEALPYKPYPLKDHHSVESVRGEASLLDSADEDSGIESCTLERKIVS